MKKDYNYSEYVKEQIGEKNFENLKIIEKELGKIFNFSSPNSEWIGDLSDIEKRSEQEIPFIITNSKDNPKILDSCLGSGSTSIGLKIYGIQNIISNDINEDLINYSQKEAKKRGVELTITRYDWREINNYFQNEFDSVCCLGNSLTYLFKKEDQVKSLHNFYDSLRHGGKLIIDERNYVEILKGNFRVTGKGPYKGKNEVKVRPIYFDSEIVIMEYYNVRHNKNYNLTIYPFKEREMESLIEESGFKNIKKYGDYEEKYNSEEVEFYTYVAEK